MERNRNYRGLIVDIMAFDQLVSGEVCIKYDGLKSTFLRCLGVFHIVCKDNNGYGTKQDVMRYTGFSLETIIKRVSYLVHNGYLVPINELSPRYARRYALSVKGENALSYYSRCMSKYLDARTSYATGLGVAFFDKSVQRRMIAEKEASGGKSRIHLNYDPMKRKRRKKKKD